MTEAPAPPEPDRPPGTPGTPGAPGTPGPSGVLAALNPMGEPETPVWRVRWFQVLLGSLVTLAVASYVLPPVLRAVYMTRPVLLPVLVGLALAYAFNPLVTWAARRHRMPRVFSAAVILIWFFGLLGLGFAWLTGPVVGQARELASNLPRYVIATQEATGDWLGLSEQTEEAMEEVVEQVAEGDLSPVVDVVLPEPEGTGGAEEAEEPEEPAAGGAGGAEPSPGVATSVEVTVEPAADPDSLFNLTPEPEVGVGVEVAENGRVEFSSEDAPTGFLDRALSRLRDMELSTLSSTGLAVLDVGASTVIGVFGLAGYFVVATLVVCFCFFYATWRWPAFVAWFLPYIPASVKPEVVRVAARMDRAVAAFLRGRLVQAAILAVVLSVGFTLVGTPAGLILGIAGGLLGLIPYAGLVVWPVAVTLSVMSGFAVDDGMSLWWAVLGPTLVFGVGQSLDAWVVEPLVQGKATDLDALTVLLVVLAGGAVAGLLGLLLAIPVAACVKILWHEVAGPRIRAVARAS